MKYMCSICVRREAETLDEIDGKHRPVCRVCTDEPVADVHLDEGPRAKALAAIRHNPGATFKELRDVLNIAGGGCHKYRRERTDEMRLVNKYCAAVSRLVKDGLVERGGSWPHWTYRVVEQRRRAA